MAVLKDYKCKRCGYFESFASVCPTCGTDDVKAVYLKAPSFKSDKTKFVDDNTEQFVRQSGLSNFQNNPSTTHAPAPVDIWKPYNTENVGAVTKELQQARSEGIVQALKPSLPGKVDTIYHTEDIGADGRPKPKPQVAA